ncbi:MAG TPA: serine protease, partial [Planctomycetaceae bacterium]|nr:serine protease [Planctomycetaceae bacterium]
MVFAASLGVALLFTTSVSLAQSVCLPAPRLLTTLPMGGKAGTEVEIAITGEHLDDAGELAFSDPRIASTRKLDAAGQPVPNKYVVSIAADCPVGVYETRVMTRLGVSSSRIFSVGSLTEVTRQAPNTSLATAMELPMNSVCNGAMTTRAVDHYVFEGRKGQRVVVDCATKGIDSKLDVVLIVADSAGRDLLVERRGGALDFTVPEDGRYVIKLHELTYKGGPEYFYRLAVREWPADAPILRQPSTRTVSSFSWPPEGLRDQAEAAEQEPNNDRTVAQRIALPCDIAGSFFPAADVDVFEFEAKKGDVWWVEVASERFGLPTDPAILVQHVTAGSPEKLTDVAEFSDIPSPVKVSSNGYAYDGPPYDAGSPDILGKLEITEDGVHRLQLSDLFGGTRKDPRNVYRLVIRKAAPDFAVVAWAMHMELRNGDRNALSKPLALRGGATMPLEVVVVRRDGFDGDIELVMEGLPEGVTARGLKIPAGQSRGLMLVTAHQNAPRALASAKFFGRAQINGATVERPCRLASMAWPIADAWGEIPHPRLLADVPVSVGGFDFAPISIATSSNGVHEVAAGQKLTIPLVQARRGDFSGATMQLKTMGAGFDRAAAFDVALTADTSQAVLDLAALKTPPGDYLIAFYGSAVAKYRHHP